MKKVGKSVAAALVLILMWCIGWTIPAYASGNPSVALESAGMDAAGKTLWVNCNLERMDTVTNGKVRITYDGNKLKLLENQKGGALSNGMCEVNDCLTGNKEEGEIVLAFASSEELSAKGCLANMKFSVADAAADGEEVKLKIAVEKMAGEKGDIPAEKKDLTVKIKKSNPGNTGGSQGGTVSAAETATAAKGGMQARQAYRAIVIGTVSGAGETVRAAAVSQEETKEAAPPGAVSEAAMQGKTETRKIVQHPMYQVKMESQKQILS